jgi:hypothetical protein
MPSSLLMRAKEYRTSAKDHNRHGHIEYSEMGKGRPQGISCCMRAKRITFSNVLKERGGIMGGIWYGAQFTLKTAKWSAPASLQNRKNKRKKNDLKKTGFLCGPLTFAFGHH